MKISIIIFLIVCLSVSKSQEDREWKPKSFDSLDINELQIDSSDSPVNQLYSKGYFPHPVESDFKIGFTNNFEFNISGAASITPEGLANTGDRYSYGRYSTDEKHYFKEKFSDEDESVYEEAWNYRIGIDTKYNPAWNLPLLFRTSITYNWSDDILFAPRKTKYYLNPFKGKTSYQEQSLLHLDEEFIDFTQAIMIPLYGAFITGGVISHYYLMLGGNISYITTSNVNQFHQILTEKNDIRFENGFDSIRVRSEYELPNLNRIRYGIEVGFGSVFDTNIITFGFETKAYIPLTSVITDEYWKVYRAGFNFYFMINP